MNAYTGAKVFSATLARDRQVLGERMTSWLRENRVDVVDTVVRQSSDSTHHCLTFVVFYRHRRVR